MNNPSKALKNNVREMALYTLPMWCDKSVSMLKPQRSFTRAVRSRTVQFYAPLRMINVNFIIYLNVQQEKAKQWCGGKWGDREIEMNGFN